MADFVLIQEGQSGQTGEGVMGGHNEDSKVRVSGDRAIAEYESKPADDVHRELKKAGIDPRPMTERIKELVREKLARLDRQP